MSSSANSQMSADRKVVFGLGELGMTRWLEKPPDPSAVQAQEPKTRVVPSGTLLVSLDPAIAPMNSPNPLPGAPAVGVYRQACSGIPLAIGLYIGIDCSRTQWCKEYKDLDRFGSRGVLYPTFCVVACIVLGVDYVLRGSLPALIYPGGQDYMKSPSRV